MCEFCFLGLSMHTPVPSRPATTGWCHNDSSSLKAGKSEDNSGNVKPKFKMTWGLYARAPRVRLTIKVHSDMEKNNILAED